MRLTVRLSMSDDKINPDLLLEKTCFCQAGGEWGALRIKATQELLASPSSSAVHGQQQLLWHLLQLLGALLRY